MHITAVLLRWYRSFNTATIGPNDPEPIGRWHEFKGQSFPFVRVPLDRRITSVVGANESGKSHLLSAIAKVVNGKGLPGTAMDVYAIKDVCRYCGFDALQHLWPEIGIEITVGNSEAILFEPDTPAEPVEGGKSASDEAAPEKSTITIILNGDDPEKYAKAYRDGVFVKTFSRAAWNDLARGSLPSIEVLDANWALPGAVHIDELIDIYNKQPPKPVIDPLAVQELWREVEGVEIGDTVDAPTLERLRGIRQKISDSTRTMPEREHELVFLLFSDVLGVGLPDLRRMREYTNAEPGYVSWISDDINSRIDAALDLSRYWDQDEDFKLTVNYKSGTFHFEITDRTGSTYTFSERSSGLRYFLSYYIQAKALERRFAAKGVVILMDEPDSFLSASGQKSLLRVFEELVERRRAHGSCQLVYTTHSPFLINKNFPDRVRLVRKGDGSEGTQYVQRPAIRRFEPVRTALSIDAADTLFLGSTNVVLEGYSDVKLITACIQRFGEPGTLEEVLDLNAVTLVAAGGALFTPQLVRKALKGDEKPPVVVVLLDGDEAGMTAASAVARILDAKQIATLRSIDSGTQVFQVLEDLVPASLVNCGVQAFSQRLGVSLAATFDGTAPGAHSAEQIVSFCRTHISGLEGHGDLEIRSGVVDSLVELLEEPEFHHAGTVALASNIRLICKHLNEMIEYAQRNAQRRSLKSLVRRQVETFTKRFFAGASKGDVRKLLNNLKHVAFGPAEDFDRTRHNVDLMLERLDKEASQNSDPIVLDTWQKRLARFKDEPWAKSTDWSKIGSAIALAKPANHAVIANDGPVIH